MIAVDVGNARIKFGWFSCPQGGRGQSHFCGDHASRGARPQKSGQSPVLPVPEATLRLDGRTPDFAPLAEWIEECFTMAAISPGDSPIFGRTLRVRARKLGQFPLPPWPGTSAA